MNRKPALFERAFRIISAAALLVAIAGAPKSAALAQLAPLIPRTVVLGNPERERPALSPDGKRIAWLAPDRRGVRQVWVGAIGAKEGRAVTADPARGISIYRWAWDSRTILYQQDHEGDENYHLYAADPDSGNVRDLTPWSGVRAEFIGSNPRFPDQMLAGMNLRDRKLMDVWRIDIRTGAAHLDTQNPGDVAAWFADDNLEVRAAEIVTPDGGTEIRVRADSRGPWRTLMRVGASDRLDPIDFTSDGQSIYLQSSVGSNTARVVLRDISSGREKAIAASDAADVEDVLIHPARHRVEAVAAAPARRQWIVADGTVATDFGALRELAGGDDFDVLSRDLKDENWIVSLNSDRDSARYYLWERLKKKAKFLFAARPALKDFTLAATKPVDFTARDGMALHAFLTLPPALPAKNLPMVLVVHGGPWARVRWEYSGTVQLLANRGYAVLEVNFRGSDGYGKKYLHAGDRQWGLRMHDDLIDGVNWAVKQGIADPKRIAIDGGSYGGYAALAGAAFTPDVFRCAIDEFGPSNLFTLFASFPPYWATFRAVFIQRVGDPDKNKELLRWASPLFSADRIRIPLLIGQGANDVRVTPAESEQILAAIAKRGGRASYVLYSDEGHGFFRPQNSLDFCARMERFLADNLGGRYEPMDGERYPGSTAVVREIGIRNKDINHEGTKTLRRQRARSD